MRVNISKRSSAMSAASGGERARWLALIAACFGLAMLYIDLFIVNVALPAIARDFHASLGEVSWTISGYVVMIGVLPMGLGRLSDLWGQRRVYLIGLALFTMASLGCGLAPTLPLLIACRLAQGIGAAVMTPSTLSIVTRAFPPAERGLALGIYGGVSSLGLVAGPLLGGILVNGGAWRWVFFINVPLGLVGLLLTALYVAEARDEHAPPTLDWAGLVTLSAGLLALMLACTTAETSGWGAPDVLLALALGALLLAAFVLIERRVRWPLVDLALFRNRAFVLGSLSFFLYSAALFGSQPYWSLFMQNTLGFSPLAGGLAFLPATGLIALLTPASGLIAQWAGTRLRLVTVGGALTIGLSFVYVAATLGPHSTYAVNLLPAFLTRGIGIPLFSTCATLLIMNAVPDTMSGLASGTLSMARNIGTAFGVALFGSVYLRAIDTTLPAQFAGFPVSRALALQHAAEQFVARAPGSSPQVGTVVTRAIDTGFAQQALAGALLCGLAALAALYVARTRPRLTHAPLAAVSAVAHSVAETRQDAGQEARQAAPTRVAPAVHRAAE